MMEVDVPDPQAWNPPRADEEVPMKRKAIVLRIDETGRQVPVEVEIDEPDVIQAPPPPPIGTRVPILPLIRERRNPIAEA